MLQPAVVIPLCASCKRDHVCLTSSGARLGDGQVSPLAPRCPQPSCLCCLWPGVCRSPLPSRHMFMGIFLSFPLRLPHAVPQQPYKPLLIWVAAALPFSPSPAVTPREKYFFPANPESLLRFTKGPPVRHSRKLMFRAASTVRSFLQLWTTMGRIWPPWPSGFLAHWNREGFLVCPAERRSGSSPWPMGRL